MNTRDRWLADELDKTADRLLAVLLAPPAEPQERRLVRKDAERIRERLRNSYLAWEGITTPVEQRRRELLLEAAQAITNLLKAAASPAPGTRQEER